MFLIIGDDCRWRWCSFQGEGTEASRHRVERKGKKRIHMDMQDGQDKGKIIGLGFRLRGNDER